MHISSDDQIKAIKQINQLKAKEINLRRKYQRGIINSIEYQQQLSQTQYKIHNLSKLLEISTKGFGSSSGKEQQSNNN